MEHASKLIGYPTPPADETDFLYFGPRVASGFALGLLGVPFGGATLGLGNAPVLDYTVPYTIANVSLTLAGSIVVMIS